MKNGTKLPIPLYGTESSGKNNLNQTMGFGVPRAVNLGLGPQDPIVSQSPHVVLPT